MPYPSKSIANYFLDLARAAGDSISPMKLQKLVYYAHGWYVGNTGNPLIDESVQAWQYGPVIPSLYQEFKRFGAGKIEAKATDFDPAECDFTEVSIPDDPNLRRFLDSVWTNYGKFTGARLSEMTHAADGPWDITRRESKGVRNTEIPLARIAEHFAKAVQEAKARSAAA